MSGVIAGTIGASVVGTRADSGNVGRIAFQQSRLDLLRILVNPECRANQVKPPIANQESPYPDTPVWPMGQKPSRISRSWLSVESCHGCVTNTASVSWS